MAKFDLDGVQGDAGCVLVVDDVSAEEIAENARRALVSMFPSENQRPEVVYATDAVEAKRLIELHKNRTWVAFIDMSLDGNPNDKQGLDLVRLLRSGQPPRTPQIVVLTQHGNMLNVFESLKAGADQYLDKGIEPPAEMLRLVLKESYRRAFFEKYAWEASPKSKPAGGWPTWLHWD